MAVSTGMIRLERAQHFNCFLELSLRTCGFEAWETAAFEQDIVAVAVEHEALPADFDGADVFSSGEGFDAGGLQEIGGGFGDAAEAVAPGCFEGGDGFFGAGFGEFAVGGDAELCFTEPCGGEEGW